LKILTIAEDFSLHFRASHRLELASSKEGPSSKNCKKHQLRKNCKKFNIRWPEYAQLRG
jgi:hypothetical protein